MKIKLVNLNIWLGGQIFEPMIDFLKTEKADILTLQEVHNEKSKKLPKNFRSLEIIKNKLNYPYVSFAPSTLWNNGKIKSDIGNAILSRFPIKSDSYIFYNTPYGEYTEGVVDEYPNISRTLQHVEIDIGKTILNVFNTQGIWGFDGLDNQRRLKMGSMIAEMVKNKKNVVLAGDFNMEANTKSMGKIGKYLKNVFKNELATSFNMKRKTSPGYASAVVDMIFISPNIKVIEHSCPKVDVSDHLPLVCTLDV